MNQKFFSAMLPVEIVKALMAGEAQWNQDCGTQVVNCLVTLLEDLPDEPLPTPGYHAGVMMGEDKIDEFDPFEDPEVYEEKEASTVDAENPSAAPIMEAAAPSTPLVEDQPSVRPEVSVSVHQVKNPYKVRCDALVYPANNNLAIDDPLLLRMTSGQLQEECDRIARPVRMGYVYPTSAGPKHERGVEAGMIFHAVVSGGSRLVNEQDVVSAMKRTLKLADQFGMKRIAIMPCDCGTHDLNQVALAQVGAVKTYLEKNQVKSLEAVYFVMQDIDSTQCFEFYFDRIFGRKQ